LDGSGDAGLREPLTGWRVVPAKGLVADEVFFEFLAKKRFPAGAFIRDANEMEYAEEPDIFHDVFGHVPLLADPLYARFMEAYGQSGQRAMAQGQLHRFARLYWYTIEVGLMASANGPKLFGAGIMSSTAESAFALESPAPNRIAFDLERVMRTKYVIDDFQQTYFVIDSFDTLADTFLSEMAPVYERLEALADLDARDVLSTDVVLHRGTGRR
jgi:phenylalanine-4-hydroxylase